MLIGIDASRALRKQRTGTENYSLFLIRALASAGNQHTFRLYTDVKPLGGVLPEGPNVEWRVLPQRRLWTHVRLSREMLQHPPDVLFVPAHVIPLVHPRRCVATVHDLGFVHYPTMHAPMERRYLDWSTRWNAHVAMRVIADSAATRDDLVRLYGTSPEKIVVAYPAGSEDVAPVVDSRRLATVRERYGTGDRYLLYVGTLQPRKNLDTLIRAYQSLLSRGKVPPEIRLVLAGREGWHAEQLRRVSAQGDAGCVVFTGYVPDDDLPALMSGALAFVLPSWYEGWSLPVLEAMACGTAVICSNVSCLPELVGDAAVLFAPGDQSALENAILRLVSDEGYRCAIGGRGAVRARRFTWGQCAAQVLAALEEAGERGVSGG